MADFLADIVKRAFESGNNEDGGHEGGSSTVRFADEPAPGDVAVLDAPTYVHVPYNFGVNTVDAVLKDGEVVY